MRGWAEFVLRHRRWVIGFWLLVIVVGGALSSKVNDRLTIDFSLPGQPGTETAQKIQELVDNGGFTSPYIVTVTVPQGKVTDPANATAIDKAFGALAKRDALAVPAQQRA
ncbi:MAG: putative drug exporter of the superfamily, partial [Pseudonocardiales bacterium]|nr:putative drug exporter of the superfamily [Pseudonocardiales bacterium]